MWKAANLSLETVPSISDGKDDWQVMSGIVEWMKHQRAGYEVLGDLHGCYLCSEVEYNVFAC
jgi:hypothetical protein